MNIGTPCIYYPAANETLPNGMKCAPAIITQIFGDPEDVKVANLTVFVSSGETPVLARFSVFHAHHPLFEGNEGCAHFKTH